MEDSQALATRVINRAIVNESLILDLSDLSLTYIKIPFQKLKHVEELYLNGNNLVELPEEIGRLPNLRILNIADNRLTDLPYTLKYTSTLHTLEARNNDFTKFPDILLDCIKLHRLSLDNSSITYIPEKIANLADLTWLSLSNCKLTHLPGMVGKLKNLTFLDLNNNKLTSLPADLCEIVVLKELILSNNLLDELPTNFGSLNQLKEISINNNKLKKLPESIGSLKSLKKASLSRNKLCELPNSFKNLTNISSLDLDFNSLNYLPNDFGENLTFVMKLNLSHNQLKKLPEKFGDIKILRELYINNNQLKELPSSFSNLKYLSTLNIRDNKFEVYPAELSAFRDISTMIDYRGNPFAEKAIFRSERFTKIWQQAPHHLREILKIYFSGFSVFYAQRTQQSLKFNVINELDGLAFEVIPTEENDPEQVEALLNEYFQILKSKLQEGAQSGTVYPMATNDPANLFAQIQASNFAQNATAIKHTVDSYISNQEVLTKVSETINELQANFHSVLDTARHLGRELAIKSEKVAELKGIAGAQSSELEHRRDESRIRASTPITINVSQQVHLQQQIGDDYAKLRELLHPRLTEFQREEAKTIQQELDKAGGQTTTLKPEEKASLSKRIKRWVEGAKAAMKVGKEAGEVTTDLAQYWDKLKDFAEGVLNDPELVKTITDIKEMAESAL